MEDINMLIVG